LIVESKVCSGQEELVIAASLVQREDEPFRIMTVTARLWAPWLRASF